MSNSAKSMRSREGKIKNAEQPRGNGASRPEDEKKFLESMIRSAETPEAAEEIFRTFSDSGLMSEEEFRKIIQERAGSPKEEPKEQPEEMRETVETVKPAEAPETKEAPRAKEPTPQKLEAAPLSSILARIAQRIENQVRERREAHRAQEQAMREEAGKERGKGKRKIPRTPEKETLGEVLGAGILEEGFKPTEEMLRLARKMPEYGKKASRSIARIQTSTKEEPDATILKSLVKIDESIDRILIVKNMLRNAEIEAREELKETRESAQKPIEEKKIPPFRWRIGSLEKTQKEREEMARRERIEREAALKAKKEEKRKRYLWWPGATPEKTVSERDFLDTLAVEFSLGKISAEEYDKKAEALKRIQSSPSPLEEAITAYAEGALSDNEYDMLMHTYSQKENRPADADPFILFSEGKISEQEFEERTK